MCVPARVAPEQPAVCFLRIGLDVLLDACYVLLNVDLNKIKQASDLRDLSET